MDLELLARIAHASAESDPPPFPDTFKAVRNRQDLVQPEGGLWCSSVTARSTEGAPIATAWTEWRTTQNKLFGRPSELDGRYTQFSEVEPMPRARIYLIDTADDLDRLVAAFPLPLWHLMVRTAPDWEAMAVSGWDAVYVSEAGLTASAERTPLFEPSLGRWDCPSVLWLRPAYRLTRP
jgi:hypothetical protein